MSELDWHNIRLLDDITYFLGLSETQKVAGMLDDLDELELWYTLRELKGLVLTNLMKEEDKS